MSFTGHFRKDFRLIFRDPKGLFLGLLVPALTLLVYSALDLSAWATGGRNPDAFILTLAVSFPSLLLAKSAIIDERKQGTFQRLSKSPTTMASFVGSKSLGALLLIILQVGVIFLVSIWTLSADLLEVAAVLGPTLVLTGLASHGLGLVISSLCRTENQASHFTSLALLLMLVLSGFLRPLEGLGLLGRVAELSPMALGYSSSSGSLAGDLIVGGLSLLGLVYVALLTVAAVVTHLRRGS